MRLFLLSCLLLACPAPGPAPVETDTDTDSDSDTDSDTDTDTDTDPNAWMDSWSFQPIPGMVCGGGAETGIGISEGTDPTELVVYMVGGGGCWDALTCFGLQTAANLEVAWGDAQLRSELIPVEGSGLLDRNDPSSDVHDATWVYIPYCTGDLHTGTTVQLYDPLFNPGREIHHAGENNVGLVLANLRASHPNAERIWLVGGSAGGYGAQLQAHRFQATWPEAQLSVFADGSPMIQPNEYRWSAWQTAWEPLLPQDCVDCPASFPAMLAARSASIPDVPYALAVTTRDPIITVFFAQALDGQLNVSLTRLIEDQYEPSAQLSVFREDGEGHVLLGDAQNHVAADGTVLRDWFHDWVEGVPLSDHP